MSQIKIQTKDLTGAPVKEASVVFNLEGKGLIERTTDSLGNTSISGIEVGVLPVTITKPVGTISLSGDYSILNDGSNVNITNSKID